LTGWLTVMGLAVFGSVWTASPGGALHRLAPPGLQTRGRWRIPTPAVALVALSAGSTWAVAGMGLRALGLGLGVGVASAVIRRVGRDWRTRRLRRERQRAVIEFCDSLGAELRAGLPADQSLERACTLRREWACIVAAARLGGDVAEAMRRASAEPGSEGLRAVAAGWVVAGNAGAGLATVLQRLSVGLRSDEEARSEVIASLGPPRATAKMLAVLPVFGLALGSSMGARPVAFLLHTDIGLGCLTLGLVLAALGVWWVERLATAAEM